MINPGNSQEKREMDEVVAQEQEQQLVAPTSDKSNEQEVAPAGQDASESVVTSEAPARRRGKKRVKRVRQVTEEELMPRPSIWPLALAVSLCVMLVGIAVHPILLGIGVLLVIASIIGWGVERR
jgi:Cytochrome c oxidase subunit IV